MRAEGKRREWHWRCDHRFELSKTEQLLTVKVILMHNRMLLLRKCQELQQLVWLACFVTSPGIRSSPQKGRLPWDRECAAPSVIRIVYRGNHPSRRRLFGRHIILPCHRTTLQDSTWVRCVLVHSETCGLRGKSRTEILINGRDWTETLVTHLNCSIIGLRWILRELKYRESCEIWKLLFF